MNTSALTPLLLGGMLLTISDAGPSTLVVTLSEEQLATAGGALAVYEAASGRDDLCDRFDTFTLSLSGIGEPDPSVLALAGTGGPPVASRSSTGALAGKVVALSAGHGVYFSEDRGVWTTQRGEHLGIVEDRWTVRFVSMWLAPMLEGAGAVILDTRGPVSSGPEVRVGATDESVSLLGGIWTITDPDGSAIECTPGVTGCAASFDVPVASSDLSPVFVRHPDPGTAQPIVSWTIQSIDATHTMQLVPDDTHGMWSILGRFWLEESEVVTLTVEAPPGSEGVLSLGGVRIGGGLGDTEREGECSGEARFEEAAMYWLQSAGAPGWVTGCTDTDLFSDRRARSRYAAWAGADVFVSIHTNGGGGTGTVTFTHESYPPPLSDVLADGLQRSVVETIRAQWDPDWTDRGIKHVNLDELADARPMPSVLLEVGFHDNEHDAWLLRQPALRRDVSRAIVRGVAGFVSPGTDFVPPSPTITRVTGQGGGQAIVTWEPGDDPLVPPDDWSYTLHVASSGRGMGRPMELEGCCSALVDGLPTAVVLTMRLTAVSEGGSSLPSNAASVILGDSTARVLLVDGFERRDEVVDETVNTLDSAYDHALAIHSAAGGNVAADFATPSVAALLLPSRSLVLVDWIEGLDPGTGQLLLDDQARALLAHLEAGGCVLISGENIASGLWEASGAGRELLEEGMRAVPMESAPCGGPILLALDDSVLHDANFGDGPTGFAPPRSLRLGPGTSAFATCETGEPVAAISAPIGEEIGMGVLLNMPFEAIGSPSERARIMQMLLASIVDPDDGDPDPDPPRTDPAEPLDPPGPSHGCSIALAM